MQGEPLLDLLNVPVLPGDQRTAPPVVLIRPKVDIVSQDDPLLQQSVKIVEPYHRVNAGDLPCFLRPKSSSIPFFLYLVWPRKHQDLPVADIRMIREKYDHAVFLHNT